MGPMQTSTTIFSAILLWIDHRRRDLRHIHSSRLPARYHADHVYQTDLQVRLSWWTLGRFLRYNCVRVLRPDLRRMLGTLAPWADHARIAPRTFELVSSSPSSPSSWCRSSFIGSLFFMVGALSRRIFIVYCRALRFLIIYLFYARRLSFNSQHSTAFLAGHLRSGRHPPQRRLSRYWTVVDKNTLLFSWSPHSRRGCSSTTASSGLASAFSPWRSLDVLPDVSGGAHRSRQ